MQFSIDFVVTVIDDCYPLLVQFHNFDGGKMMHQIFCYFLISFISNLNLSYLIICSGKNYCINFIINSCSEQSVLLYFIFCYCVFLLKLMMGLFSGFIVVGIGREFVLHFFYHCSQFIIVSMIDKLCLKFETILQLFSSAR